MLQTSFSHVQSYRMNDNMKSFCNSRRLRSLAWSTSKTSMLRTVLQCELKELIFPLFGELLQPMRSVQLLIIQKQR